MTNTKFLFLLYVALLQDACVSAGTRVSSTDLVCTRQTVSAVTLSWSKVQGATLYEVVGGNESSIASFPFLSMTSASTTVTVVDLLPGYSYIFKVRAHVGFDKTQMILGWTDFSETKPCATKFANPLAPINLRRLTNQLYDNKIDIRWDRPLGYSRTHGTVTYTVSSGGCSSLQSHVASQNHDWDVLWTTPNISSEIGNLPSNSVCSIKVTAVYSNFGVSEESEVQQFRTANPNTTWIQTHRVTENSRADVDFLSNHNSGTLEADVAFMTFQGNSSRFFDFLHSPETGFCVEIQKVNLSSIKRTPSNPEAIPMPVGYADYISCNGDRTDPPPGTGWGNYTCVCDNEIDRVIAHQSQHLINRLCPNTSAAPVIHGRFPMNPCHCNAESLAYSAKYTGWMPVSLPWITFDSPVWPPVPPAELTPYGGWFHHPSGAKCDDTVTSAIGDASGCTWKRHPRAVMVYGGDLLLAGWNMSDAPSTRAIKNNVLAAERAYDQLPVHQRCCGC
eukprot:m.478403 g.478403  ORF g.478403 m.478403 type:complete len:504 (-) comp21692_c0_seq8:1252-2763(-)